MRSIAARTGGSGKHGPSQGGPSQGGFGLIEVVVSMFLFALTAMAFVPVMINSLGLTANTATLSTATQLLNQQIERARSQPATCAALTAFVAETIPPVVDPRGISLQAKRDPVTCPTSYPGTVAVHISVAVTGSSTPLASADSLIFVGRAS
ncbi:MAG: type IV pilus modification PilV family protein [Microbacteriaceae bacterium]